MLALHPPIVPSPHMLRCYFEVILSHSFIGKYKIILMSRREFNKCPECNIGTLRPTGEATTSMNPDTDKVKGDSLGYKCDNPACGYPRGDVARVFQNNEGLNVTDSTFATVKNSDGSGEGDTSSSIINKDDQQ